MFGWPQAEQLAWCQRHRTLQSREKVLRNRLWMALVWLLLLCISLGALYRSGLLHFNGREYRQRVAMRVVFERVDSIASGVLTRSIISMILE